MDARIRESRAARAHALSSHQRHLPKSREVRKSWHRPDLVANHTPKGRHFADKVPTYKLGDFLLEFVTDLIFIAVESTQTSRAPERPSLDVG